MKQKAIALLTLCSFVFFTFSCFAIYKTKKEKIETVKSWKGESFEILAVLKKSGEEVKFSKKNPGRIQNDFIVGGGSLEIEKSQIEKKIIKRGKIVELRIKDGQAFLNPEVLSETQSKITISNPGARMSIPIEEVELVWIRKFDPGLTFLASVGVIGGVLVGIGIIAMATKQSCPFIYSFDGENYIFDAEPYGGAICKGLQRTEWCTLENLKQVEGQYKLKITSEVGETQYTDEIKLLVIDHPQGTIAIPDERGEIHTVFDPYEPALAYEANGRDILSYVTKNDWIYWQTRIEEKDPYKKASLKDELIFEFPKPEGVSKAKLIFNGCNTLWGSQMIRRSLELYGNKLQEWYKEVSNKGPAFYQMQTMVLREELYRLQFRVETENGWKSKGLILGGGPFISEDRIYTIDLRDVPGETVRIKLTPPAIYWMINYLGMDYSSDQPVSIIELEPLEVIDNLGQDKRDTLAANDGNYLVMPYIGDSADVVFAAPPIIPGMERTIVLKASGYYDIHLDAKGEPKIEILEKMRHEPGFIIQYAIKEIQSWEKENLERIKRK